MLSRIVKQIGVNTAQCCSVVSLKLTLSDLEKTMTQMDRVIEFHAVADTVEAKVRQGPTTDIKGFLELLDKLKGALDFFTVSNPHSVELGHVGELFEVGLETLAREFLQLLKKYSKPVPVAMLNDIATIEDSEGTTHTHTHTRTHTIPSCLYPPPPTHTQTFTACNPLTHTQTCLLWSCCLCVW